MTWVELAAVGAAGVVAGWAAHAVYRWARSIPATSTDVPRPSGVSGDDPADPAKAPTPTARPRKLSEGASAAGRVILHLYAQGRLAPHEVADPEFTQEGIGSALELRQGTVARVLGRLAAAGILQSDRRHVTGRARRLTVYTLTPLGESVARDLRRTNAASADASSAGPKDPVARERPRIPG